MKTAAIVTATGIMLGVGGVAYLKPTTSGITLVFACSFAIAILLVTLLTRKRKAQE